MGLVKMDHKTKGWIVITLGITLIVFWLITRFFVTGGQIYFILLLVAMYLIYEGNRLRKNKKSSLFDPDASYWKK
jgi:uncharacterized membrane protein